VDTGRQISVIILAGGNAVRIGKNKALLLLNGITFIEHVINQIKPISDEIIISSNNPALYKNLQCNIVQDNIEGQGPLMGIYSCLKDAKNEVSFVLACDVPKINLSLLRKLLSYSADYDIVVPILSDGKYEPLYAVYKKSAVHAIKDVLDSGRRKISLIFDRLNVKYVPVYDLNWYHNINTEEDYRKLIEDIYTD
jgi:molybdenum cofactor guanylyltransferase